MPDMHWEGAVRWGSGPVSFELRSPDADILAEAECVFGAWRSSGINELVGSWTARWIDDEIVVDPRPPLADGTPHDVVRTAAHAVGIVEYAAVARIVETCDHLLCFHAALLGKHGNGVAIVGASCAGKSTLATGLWQNGWNFLCDDLTIAVGRKATPAPRRVALRKASKALVGDSLWNSIRNTDGYFEASESCLFQPMQIDGGEPHSVDLSAIVFLNRSGARGEASVPERLAPAHAAMALLPYTNLVRRLPFTSALVPVAQLAAEVPAWDLPRMALPEMVAAVEHLVARA